jgi:hypothetical protein
VQPKDALESIIEAFLFYCKAFVGAVITYSLTSGTVYFVLLSLAPPITKTLSSVV